MYIIEAHNNIMAWISGIFQDEEAAMQYSDSIPDELKDYQRIISISTLNYPFYIVEEGKTFRYLNHVDVEGLLDNINKLDDEDYVYFNLYFITEDYRPRKPGTDYMGILNHLHINNGFLEHYQAYGNDLLVRNRMV
ncbi:hypothetical protein ACFCP7_09735 [Paenibacillus elgii]